MCTYAFVYPESTVCFSRFEGSDTKLHVLPKPRTIESQFVSCEDIGM